MSKTILTSVTDKADRAASEIASVWQTTRHVHLVWTAIDPEARMGIVHVWAQLIQEDPDQALLHILADIRNRAELWEAWNKLEPQEKATRESIFQGILNQNGF